ncbi:MAG: hypothetical protein Q9160_001776 [Pyrenula sp. 1 TL-2023]
MSDSKQSQSNAKYGPTSTDNYVPSKDTSANVSDYKYVQDGWGNRQNFTMSYGEKPTPEGFNEATRVLGALRQDHPGSAAGQKYRAETKEMEK